MAVRDGRYGSRWNLHASCEYFLFSSVLHECKQVVEVIRHQAASLPHMDGSVARLRQCAPHLVHSNRHLHHAGAAPC